MWAPSSPQRARPSHALVPPTFPPSCTPPRNSNPSPLFYASIPSLFPLLFASFSIVLLCFDSIFASFYPPFHSPQMHVGGRTRGESNPTVTQLPPGTSASKSTTVAILIRWGSASKVSVWRRPPPRTPYSHFVRNEQLRHAWQLAFVITYVLSCFIQAVLFYKRWRRNQKGQRNEIGQHSTDPWLQTISYMHIISLSLTCWGQNPLCIIS